jgi:hypothetical protein
MSVGGAWLSTHFFELVWEKAGAWIMWPIIIAGLLYAYLEGLLAI